MKTRLAKGHGRFRFERSGLLQKGMQGELRIGKSPLIIPIFSLSRNFVFIAIAQTARRCKLGDWQATMFSFFADIMVKM